MSERDQILSRLKDADAALGDLEDELGEGRVITEYCRRARAQIAEAIATRRAELSSGRRREPVQ